MAEGPPLGTACILKSEETAPCHGGTAPNAKQARPVVRACRLEGYPWATPQPARSAYPAMDYNLVT